MKQDGLERPRGHQGQSSRETDSNGELATLKSHFLMVYWGVKKKKNPKTSLLKKMKNFGQSYFKKYIIFSN